jgi:hypothetical protein
MYLFGSNILLAGTVVGLLFGNSLESTVSKLGRSIDKLERDFFQSRTSGVDQQRLAESQDTLLDTDSRALDHDKVILDNTVVREAAHGSDGLFRQIVLGRGVLGVSGRSDTVDLLVGFGTVMETVLTSTRNRVHDTGRMPSTDTSDLTETLVSLTGELLGTPTMSNTFETFTLGDTNDINHFVLFKDGVDVNGLFKVRTSPFELVGNGATVQLDFNQVSLLDTEVGDGLVLSVDKDTDNLAVFLIIKLIVFNK